MEIYKFNLKHNQTRNFNNWFCYRFSAEWMVDDPPRVVLNTLESLGYKVVGMTGIGQTCAWTLFKPIQ